MFDITYSSKIKKEDPVRDLPSPNRDYYYLLKNYFFTNCFSLLKDL